MLQNRQTRRKIVHILGESRLMKKMEIGFIRTQFLSSQPGALIPALFIIRKHAYKRSQQKREPKLLTVLAKHNTSSSVLAQNLFYAIRRSLLLILRIGDLALHLLFQPLLGAYLPSISKLPGSVKDSPTSFSRVIS
jgi:hypothetical protein